jgi:RNA polymerase sigma-70 factor, ECF subfamily
MSKRQPNQGTYARPFHDDERQQALLDEARAGSRAGQEALLESQRRAMTLWFQHRLTGDLQAKLDADDLVQEASWDAWQGFADFDGLSIAQYRAWLKTICRCRLAMVGRHHACGCRASHGEQALDEAALACGSQRPWRRSCLPDEECRAAELQRRYVLLLAELPADERQVLVWHCQDRDSFAEISLRLGCARSTVRDAYRRAGDALRRLVAS